MNRIKHTFILLLISLLILLFATRCGGKKTAATPASTTVKATAISTTAPTLTPTLTPTVDFGLLKGADNGAPLAPKVTGQQPEPMEELPVNGSFNVSFDQPMDQKTTAAAWKVTGPDGKAVPGKVSWPDARILRFNPDKMFLPASTYTATLTTEARSTSGKVLQDAAILNFTTTGDLQISQVSPTDGSNDVESGALITVVFNRPVVPLVTAEDASKLPNPLVITPTISGHADWLNTSVFVFHPDKPLYGSTTYHVTVKAALQDQSGGQLAKSLTWQFTTIAPSIDVFNLPGLLTSPPEGYTNIPLDQTFELNFRQAMDRASTESVFSITSNAGKAVEGSFTWNESSNQFVFKPNSRLSLGTDYTLQLDKSAQAATGGSLRDGLIWHFKTVEPPGIATTNPANGQVQSQFYPQLEINFASPMKQSTLKDKVIITPKPKGDLQWMYTDWGMYFYGLEPSTQYQVEVQPGMEDIYGNKITTSYKFHFTTASAPPEAYLVMPWTPALIRADGPQQFYATYINIQKVDFQLYRLTPEEFASLMGGNVAWSNYNPGDTTLVRKWSVTNNRGINQRALDPITLTDSQNNPLTPGIYYLGLDTGEIKHETRVLDARILIVATANLTLKKTTSEALIWLTDLDSGSPISQVPVKIYGPSFNRIGEGVTDKDGLLHVSLPVPNDPGERRYALASTEGSKPVFGLAVSDYSFDLDPSNYGVSVDYYIKPQMPVAYVYTDRPIYRPNQTVYFKGIVRLNDDLKYSLPDQKEVKVSISSYDTQVYTGTLTLSDSGSFEGKFLLDAQAALGSYAINVQFPGQEMVIGSVSFSVAEYRKPEFLLSVKASPQDIHAGDNFSATVKADFYSGGAVANADVSWVLNSTAYNFNPTGPLGQSGYSFTDFDRDVYYYGPPTEPVSKILAQGKGVTNEQGELHITLPADLSGSKSSQQLTLEATVTDVTGNSVSERATITAHLSAYYPGIKPDRYVGKTGEEQSFSVVVVDWKSNPVPDQAVNVEIVERNWYSVQEEDAQGRLRWTTTVEDKPVKTITGVKTDQYGKASVSFTPDKGGIYRARVVVRDGRGNESNASTYLWVSSDAYIPWRQENNRSFQLVADKTAYVPGDTAEILIASPFQGSAYALVTVERGHIATQEVISLTTNSTIYKLPIRPDMAPNTYVSVMVVKGASTVDGKIQPPSYKIGMVELSVATQQKAIKVEITPDRTKASPGEAVTYSIKTTDYQDKPVSAEVSLSLVDLAVLSLTGPNSQPLMDYFYPHRYLSVYTAVPLNWSIEEYNAQLKALVPSGGGMGSGGGKGSGALGVIDVRGNFLDTAYWQARLVTDDNGLAKVTVSLPDNLTTWRMDARAATLDTRVGQAIVDITSTKPLLVRPQAPRFFVAGDRAWLSAAVHNNTDQAFSVDVTLQADGVKLEDQATQTIQLNARSQAVVGWTVTVDAKAERVDLIYSAQGGGYSDASRPTLGSLEGQGIPVERYQVSETVATAGSLKNAEARNESISLPAFSDYKLNDANLSIELAPSLAAGMTDGLTYLKNYPYECTEQTVSRFLPNVLTTRALKEAGLSNPSLEANLNEQVSTALQRLYNQQHADGGWGWWEEDKSDIQVTGYVVFGLVQAQNAGYPVTPDVLKRGIQFLKDNLGSLRGVDQQYLLNRQAFVLYVLANAGEPAVSETVQFYEIRQSLSLYARAYLAQALYTINAADPRLQTLASDLISHAGLSATGAHWNEEQRDFWNWNTDTRSTAIILDTLIKIDPKDPINENAVRWLMSNRTDGRWESTQETAWSLMALTDWMVNSGELKADYMYQVALNGKSLGGEKVGPDNLRSTQKLAVDITQLMVDQANRLTIARSEGPGNLYYTARLNVSVPVEQVKALSRGITVSRNYYRMDDLHNPVTTIQQGEILLARLTVVVPHDMHYLVVEDPLPAGMEPVDASLRTSQSYQGNPSLGWTSADESQGWGWWYFNHAELRDDKVVLSVSYLPAGTYEYTYRVRATTPGTYHVIPPAAYEFYFPEVYGRGDGMLFVVTFTSR